MKNLRVGKVAITPKGEWKDCVSYEMLDAVYYNGDSYISVSDRNKSKPTENSSWKILAKGSMDGVKVVNREWFGVFDNKNNFFTIDENGSVTYASYAANPSEITINNPIRIEFDGDNYQTRVYICKRDEVQGGGQPIEIDKLSTRNGKYVFEFTPNDEERKYIRIGIICSGVVNVKVSELFIMTSAYIYNGINSKVDKTDITQSTGTSTTAVMSQKAVSDALSNSGFALLYELGFSDLRHFYASSVDASTATYYVDDGIPEWVRTCPMINNRYALNIDRFFTDNNISIERKKYTKQIKSQYVWIEIIDNNSFVAYKNNSGTLKSVIEDASTVGEFAFCEIAKGFKLDITGFSTLVFEIDKCVKNVLSSRYGLNGSSYADLLVFRERGNKYYSPDYPVNYIRGYVFTDCVASSSYSNIINIKRDNGNLEIEQAKINSSTLEIASNVNAVYENSVPLINPIVSDIQDEDKLYLSPRVNNYSAPLPYIPHTTIKVYGKK